MIDYTIAAIPTLYRGRTYRSRLEARWAAFFDLLGWQHEYEPYDLGSWSPDFQIKCADEQHPMGLLVEIKPLAIGDERDQHVADVQQKMTRACEQRGIATKVADLLLVGLAPTERHYKPFGVEEIYARLDLVFRGRRAVQIGWHGTYREKLNDWLWREAFVFWLMNHDTPRLTPDVIAWSEQCLVKGGMPWRSIIMVEISTAFDFPINNAFGDHTMGLWAQATNDVQWQPGARS
jgi:hypothetical protein